jgi:hypothetical protein
LPWTISAGTNTTVENGKIVLYSTSTTETAARGHEFSPVVALPYSFKTSVAITGNDWSEIPTNASVAFYLYFQIPQPQTSVCLYSLYVGVNPVSNAWAIRIGYKNDASAQVTYNYLETNAYGNKNIFNGLDLFKTIAVSINANKELQFFVNGAEFYRTTLLQNISNSIENKNLELRKFGYVVSPGIKLLMDDFYFTNDGTILK